MANTKKGRSIADCVLYSVRRGIERLPVKDRQADNASARNNNSFEAEDRLGRNGSRRFWRGTAAAGTVGPLIIQSP